MVSEEIIIQLRANAKDLKGQISFLQKKLDGLRMSIAKLSGQKGKSAVLKGMRVSALQTSQQIKRLRAQLATLEKPIKDAEREANRFKGEFLTALFAGMQLKRVFGAALTSIKNTYMEVAQNNTELARSLNSLKASWTFFKFSMMEALNNPFFVRLISWVIKGVNWFSQLSDGVKILIIALFAALTVLGGFLFILGQVGLVVSTWGELVTSTGKLFKTFGKGLSKIFSGVATAASTAAKGIASAFTWLMAHPVLAAIITILLVFIALIWKFRGDWREALKFMVAWLAEKGLQLLKWITKLGAGIIGVFDVAWGAVKDGFAYLANWLISKWNDLMDSLSFSISIGGEEFGIDLSRFKTDFRFATDNISQAIERFKKVQSGVSEHFDSMISEWGDVKQAIGQQGEKTPFDFLFGLKDTTTYNEQPPSQPIQNINIENNQQISVADPEEYRKIAQDETDRIASELKDLGIYTGT